MKLDSKTKEERYKLFELMREAAYVLHIHNHPNQKDVTAHCEASNADCGFARHWKSLRPELTKKMKLFVIQQHRATEYTETNKSEKQWLEQKNNSQQQISEVDHSFPLQVAKKIQREKRRKFYDDLIDRNL